jgi:hypothetical protein
MEVNILPYHFYSSLLCNLITLAPTKSLISYNISSQRNALQWHREWFLDLSKISYKHQQKTSHYYEIMSGESSCTSNFHIINPSRILTRWNCQSKNVKFFQKKTKMSLQPLEKNASAELPKRICKIYTNPLLKNNWNPPTACYKKIPMFYPF